MSVASIQTSSLAGIPTTDLAIARKILRALLPAENGIDSAIIAQTDLIGSIVRGRMEIGASIEVGHDASVLGASRPVSGSATTPRCWLHIRSRAFSRHARTPSNAISVWPSRAMRWAWMDPMSVVGPTN